MILFVYFRMISMTIDDKRRQRNWKIYRKKLKTEANFQIQNRDKINIKKKFWPSIFCPFVYENELFLYSIYGSWMEKLWNFKTKGNWMDFISVFLNRSDTCSIISSSLFESKSSVFIWVFDSKTNNQQMWLLQHNPRK